MFSIFFTANSQTYSFDFLTKYVSKDLKGNAQKDQVIYFNSDDFSYYLRLFRTPQSFYAILSDLKGRQTHVFDVVEQKNQGGINFKFKYVESKKMLINKEKYKNFRFEFEEISSDSLNLKIYNSKKAKRPTDEYSFIVKSANKPMFPMMRISAMFPFNDFSDLVLNRNVIVQKSKLTCRLHKCNCEIVLAEHKNVELDLKIPKS